MIEKLQLIDFIETHKKKLLLGLSFILVLLIIFLVFLFIHQERAKKNAGLKNSINKSTAIPIESLFLPPNPLELPDVLLYTQQSSSWFEDFAESYYVEPHEDIIADFYEKAQLEFMSIMEKVP